MVLTFDPIVSKSERGKENLMYLELMWELIFLQNIDNLSFWKIYRYPNHLCFDPIVSKSERGKENVPGIDVGIEPAG